MEATIDVRHLGWARLPGEKIALVTTTPEGTIPLNAKVLFEVDRDPGAPLLKMLAAAPALAEALRACIEEAESITARAGAEGWESAAALQIAALARDALSAAGL